MVSPVVRVLLGVALLAPLASAEEEAEADEAQGAIAEKTDELGKEAGVKDEVLSGGAYGSAGCGLGSLIFEPNESFMQVFAATTNGSFGTQTFGITSGTSNCEGAPHTAGVKNFIVANRAALTVDVARGGGETIRSLSALAQCSDDASLGSTLQKNFSGIFPNATVSDQEVSARMVQVMAQDPKLGCGALG